jgi:hypothetical protein
MEPIRLLDAFHAFKDMPHQIAAVQWLDDNLTAPQREQFGETFRAAPPLKLQPSPTPGLSTNPLPGFPYFSQNDNGPDGWRECQTSSIAMCLKYLKTPGINDDLDYLRVVQKYGDTTSQQTHVLALKALGVRARFRQDLAPAALMGEIKAGYPVAIGILHHGPVSAPSGGGHYISVYGFTDTAWVVNDPYGDLNLVNGTWLRQGGTSGRNLRYSFRNLNPRWMPGGSGGWGWVFS